VCLNLNVKLGCQKVKKFGLFLNTVVSILSQLVSQFYVIYSIFICCVLSSIKMGYIETPQYDGLSNVTLEHCTLGKNLTRGKVGGKGENLLKW
jgi:hypothetical protein